MKFTVAFTIYTVLFLSSYILAAPSSDESDEDDVEESGSSFQSRVLDGKPTQNYPHVVSLQKFKKHYCSGSIINTNWVLTSGACKADNVEVVAGTKNLKSKNRRIQRRMVKLFLGHEDFDITAPQSANDIALAKVEFPFDFNYKLVSTIDLPIAFEYPGGFAYVAGWGKFSKKNKNDSPVLRVITNFISY